jgi:hypothetical protein
MPLDDNSFPKFFPSQAAWEGWAKWQARLVKRQKKLIWTKIL